MTYRLYRLASPCDDPVDGDLIGVFIDFETALEARDDDAVMLLADAGARPMLACHTIVGPGETAPGTSHPVTSSLGHPDVNVDIMAAVSETREWLRALRTTSRSGRGESA